MVSLTHLLIAKTHEIKHHELHGGVSSPNFKSRKERDKEFERGPRMNSKLEQYDGGKAHGKNKSEEGAIVIVQGNISPERWICMLGGRTHFIPSQLSYCDTTSAVSHDAVLLCSPHQRVEYCRRGTIWGHKGKNSELREAHRRHIYRLVVELINF